ncbi:MAG: flagellar basal body rod C-terminal domain-containing protein, partial [Opitutaceae bacterium]
SGTLEQSNVDLTEEFADLITMQRSFQAGSRLITVSDSVLEDIVNLKQR